MAEIRKITCDMCGRDIKDGSTFSPAWRRHIDNCKATRGAYRFDLCEKCFEQLKKACTNARKAETDADGGQGNTQPTHGKGEQI